jgi:hypothetical protein
MYRGPWGRRLVAAVRAAGGNLGRDDLAAYCPLWVEPIRGIYHGAVVHAPGLPGLGGVHLLEALMLLERAGLERHGDPAHAADAIYWLMQITHARYLRAQAPPEERLDEQTVTRLWSEMEERGSYGVGDRRAHAASEQHTDAVVAYDCYGNMVALCHSSNTTAWGTTGLFVDGVSVPDSACFQQEDIARAGPGFRLPDPMNPVIVTREGQPFLAASCTGGAVHEVMVQKLYGVLALGQDATTAAAAPAFLGPSAAMSRDRTFREGGRPRFTILVVGVLGLGLALLAFVSVGVGPAERLRRLAWALAVVASGLVAIAVRVRLFGQGQGPCRAVTSLVARACRYFTGFLRESRTLSNPVRRGDFAEQVIRAVRAKGQSVPVLDSPAAAGAWAGISIDRHGQRHGGVTDSALQGEVVEG